MQPWPPVPAPQNLLGKQRISTARRRGYPHFTENGHVCSPYSPHWPRGWKGLCSALAAEVHPLRERRVDLCHFILDTLAPYPLLRLIGKRRGIVNSLEGIKETSIKRQHLFTPNISRRRQIRTNCGSPSLLTTYYAPQSHVSSSSHPTGSDPV